MELKNTDDLRLFIRNTIHEQCTNVTAVSRKAKVSQPSVQKFVKGKNGKAISTFTMFPVLEALGKRLMVDNVPKVTKESLLSELRTRIEEYRSSPDPKPKFSTDLIVQFLEEGYDKLATV